VTHNTCWIRGIAIVLVLGLIPAGSGVSSDAANGKKPLTIIVMDPLSAPLSCDCVKGYAQRKYEALGNYLQTQLRRPVKVCWSESLETALNDEAEGRADLVIGKYSVVLFDAKASKRTLEPVAQLSGKDGKTTQTGMFVVRSEDPAITTADLAGYRIFFGPEDCDEKFAAPRNHLKKLGLTLPEKNEEFPACSKAAAALMKLPAGSKAAAVISSYAEKLLEGCGAVKKGDLRIIGQTEELPFITAFVDSRLSASEKTAITAALLETGTVAELLTALETDSGFVEFEPPGTPVAASK